MYEIHLRQLSTSAASLGCSETQARYLVQITLALSINFFVIKTILKFTFLVEIFSAVGVVWLYYLFMDNFSSKLCNNFDRPKKGTICI